MRIPTLGFGVLCCLVFAAGSLEAQQQPGDCNGNLVLDAVDILLGNSEDCNANGLPDECELRLQDCNRNGIPDDCDIRFGSSPDENDDGIPDECDPDRRDCNGNEIPDAIEIAKGLADDCDRNGVPDVCDLPGNDCNRNRIPDNCELPGGDLNENGILDECEEPVRDCNGNEIPDQLDISSGESRDCDQNGIPDECQDAKDCNENGRPDFCEIFAGGDADGNGILDECEDPKFTDCNANGMDDTIDLAKGNSTDCDENGVPDECQSREDCNKNGIPDFCDFLAGGDANGNFILDECEEPTIVDCNGNEIDDAIDIANNTSTDCDENGVPDECQSSKDCDENGRPDFCDLLAGGDRNGNGILDACEEPITDCNGNEVDDATDIANNTSTDCDENGVPDECQSREDCNENGRPDFCELLAGGDADGNGILDECEPSITDCNGNRVPDDEDIANGTSRDCNEDGVPDECDAGEDCNGNDIPDECEPRSDCNQNGEPDFCDIAKGVSADDNGDGIPDECDSDVVVREVYEATLQSAIQLQSSGFVPQATVEYLLENEAELSTDINALASAVLVASFRRANGGTSGDGGGAAGGVVSGPTSFALSSGGLFVGSMRVDISWNNNTDVCHGDVSAHIFVGGVINGNCDSAQIGDLFTTDCLATKDCPSMTAECGTYLLQCEQSLGPLTASFNTPLESICTDCPEFPANIPGDCNSDGAIDISDAVCHFGFLFLGNPVGLPCGDESANDPANLALLDWNGDLVIDISDGIASVRWQFDAGSGAPEHTLGTECTMIPTCPQVCTP